MDAQEREVISGIFQRLEGAASLPRDPEAERLIAEKLKAQPYAPYAMAQAIYVQEQALNNLNQQLEEARAEAERARSQQGGGGFLSSLFGGGPQPEPERRAAPGRFGGPGPQPGAGAPQPGGPQGGPWGAPQPGGPMGGGMMGGQPGMFGGQQGGGGGFMRTALGAAAGVAGGMMIGSALSNAFGGDKGGNSGHGALGGNEANATPASASDHGDLSPFGDSPDAGYQPASHDQGDYGSDFGGDVGGSDDFA